MTYLKTRSDYHDLELSDSAQDFILPRWLKPMSLLLIGFILGVITNWKWQEAEVPESSIATEKVAATAVVKPTHQHAVNDKNKKYFYKKDQPVKTSSSVSKA